MSSACLQLPAKSNLSFTSKKTTTRRRASRLAKLLLVYLSPPLPPSLKKALLELSEVWVG